MDDRLTEGREAPRHTFHVKAVNVGALPGRLVELLFELLGNVHGEVHLVQRPLILPGQRLHHSWGTGQKGM